MPLKYLFSVLYKDGTRYDQNIADVSVKDPSKSCFFDIDLLNVEVFILIGPNKERYAVDLKSGLFQTLSSVWFAIHNENENLKDKQLVYFRRVTKDFNIHSGEPVNEKVVYYLGWKGLNDAGQWVPYTLAIE